MDAIFQDIGIDFFKYFFLSASIAGVIFSVILFFSPRTIPGIERVLNKKFHVDSRGIFVDTRVDIEHVFFNNHIVTALIMVALSAFLLFLNCSLDLESMQLSNWIIAFAFLKYFLFFAAFLGILFGLFMLLSPKNAFLFLRMLNKCVYTLSTDDVDIFMGNNVVEKKLYLQNHIVFSIILFLFSTALFALLARQMFF